jgi:hypothetical protein
MESMESEVMMSRQDCGRARPAEEQRQLERPSRVQAEPAASVTRAKALLAVAGGQSFTAAARTAGRQSGDAVAYLVARFNREGVAAVYPGHGGSQPKRYSVIEHERILRKFSACRTGMSTARRPGR